MNVYKILYRKLGKPKGLIIVADNEKNAKEKAKYFYSVVPDSVVLLGTQKKKDG